MLEAVSEGGSHAWAQRSLSEPPQFGAGDGPLPAQHRRAEKLGSTLHLHGMEVAASFPWHHLKARHCSGISNMAFPYFNHLRTSKM